jgi:hypothetical protein
MRFLGRKVYLGIIVILVSALEHGQSFLAGSSGSFCSTPEPASEFLAHYLISSGVEVSN